MWKNLLFHDTCFKAGGGREGKRVAFFVKMAQNWRKTDGFGLLRVHTTIPRKKMSPVSSTLGKQGAKNARGSQLAGHPVFVFQSTFSQVGHSATCFKLVIQPVGVSTNAGTFATSGFSRGVEPSTGSNCSHVQGATKKKSPACTCSLRNSQAKVKSANMFVSASPIDSGRSPGSGVARNSHSERAHWCSGPSPCTEVEAACNRPGSKDSRDVPLGLAQDVMLLHLHIEQ